MTANEPARRPALIWCPFPDVDTAKAVANSLLDEGYIACANIVPEVVSLFSWNGERDEGMETGALLKTNSALLDRAISRLAELHPYDAPAVIGWHSDAAAPDTVSWLAELGS